MLIQVTSNLSSRLSSLLTQYYITMQKLQFRLSRLSTTPHMFEEKRNIFNCEFFSIAMQTCFKALSEVWKVCFKVQHLQPQLISESIALKRTIVSIVSNTDVFFSCHVTLLWVTTQKSLRVRLVCSWQEQIRFWENAPPTPPLTQRKHKLLT